MKKFTNKKGKKKKKKIKKIKYCNKDLIHFCKFRLKSFGYIT